MAYGVTAEGFVSKPLQVILAEIQEAERTQISPSVDVSSASLFGQINGIMASHLRELWELGQAVYSAMYPDSASGLPLANVASITGTIKEGATKSTVIATVTLAAGATLPIGSAASVVGDPSKRFITTEAVTNAGGTPDDFEVLMEAEVVGPVAANAETLTVIATAVTGWTAVTNAEDAILGQDIETDADLRIRRQLELTATGNSNLDAIRAGLLKLEGMVGVSMFENVGETTDGSGLPPKSTEAVIYDGIVPALDDDVIAQRIWDTKAGGMKAYGLTGGTAVDSEGKDQAVGFSRATVTDIYMDVEVLIDPDAFPADGVTQIKTAMATRGDLIQVVGEDVVLARYYAVVMAIPGVLDLQVFQAGEDLMSLGPDNVSIGDRAIADLDTSRINVNTNV
jgi:uncharacterized phage protein gp47/JayE